MTSKFFYFNPSFWELVPIYLLQKTGRDVYVWTTSSYVKFAKLLPFPKSSYYIEIMECARNSLNNYFSSNFQNFSEIYIEDYFRKYYDLKMIEYVAFRYSIDLNFGNKDNIIIKDATFQRNIYENKMRHKKARASYFVLSVLTTLIFLVRCLSRSIMTTKKIYGTDVIYVRKKPYPDLGIRDLITEELKSKYDINVVGAYINESKYKEKFGNYFTNAFKGIERNALRAAAKAIIDSSIVSRIGGYNGINYRAFLTLLSNMYRANILILLDASIYFGVLVDKPIFILLSRYKTKKQKIISINESFHYPPFRSFDYNHLDIYFSMNDVDRHMQNKFGGKIKNYNNIEFFRKNLITYSSGISESLRVLYDEYKKMVIIAPIQISEGNFTQWGTEDLINFISSSLKLADVNKDYLFVIKGKKGELSCLPDYIMSKINNIKNVFVIHSKKPRDLKYNQFEDLLKYTTLLISMSPISTTIWQALSHRIPVIAHNDSHPKTFLSEYKYLESTSEQLQEAFSHWVNMSPDNFEIFVNEISQRVNLGNGYGLKKVADDISAILSKNE